MTQTANYGLNKRGLGARLPSGEYSTNLDRIDAEIKHRADEIAAETLARQTAITDLQTQIALDTTAAITTHTSDPNAHHPADLTGIDAIPNSVTMAGEGTLLGLKNGSSDDPTQAKWVLRDADGVTLAWLDASGKLYVKELQVDGPVTSAGTVEIDLDAIITNDLQVDGNTTLGDNASVDTLTVKAIATFMANIEARGTFALSDGAGNTIHFTRQSDGRLMLNSGLILLGNQLDLSAGRLRWSGSRLEYSNDGGLSWKGLGEIEDSSTNGRYMTNVLLSYVEPGVYEFPTAFVSGTELVHVNTTTKARGAHYGIITLAGTIMVVFDVDHIPDESALVTASYQLPGSTSNADKMADSDSPGDFYQAGSSPGAHRLRITNAQGDFEPEDMPAAALTLLYRLTLSGAWVQGATAGGWIATTPPEGLVVERLVATCRSPGDGDTQIQLAAGPAGTPPVSVMGANVLTISSAGGPWQYQAYDFPTPLEVPGNQLLTVDLPFVAGTGQQDLTIEVWGYRRV